MLSFQNYGYSQNSMALKAKNFPNIKKNTLKTLQQRIKYVKDSPKLIETISKNLKENKITLDTANKQISNILENVKNFTKYIKR